jgi:hypothetical protein
MRTKKKKSTRSFTKKKRGGAHGLVLNIMYNKNNEIIDIQTQDILANKDYKDLNYIDPKYHVTDLFKNFSDVFESTHEFFHPSDNPLRSTRKRIVKIAVNNKRDIQLIQITNKIIKALNTFKNRSVRPFIIVRRNGRITPDCEEHFKHTYKLLLRDVADAILEKVGGGGKDFKNVARLMLETPVLVNLMSIKFGLLRRGDMKMEEIRRMFGKTDELVDSLKLLKYQQPSDPIVGLDEILEEENKKRKNRIMDTLDKIKEIKNCAETGTCPIQPQSNPPQSNPPQSNPPQSNPPQSNPPQSNPPTSA